MTRTLFLKLDNTYFTLNSMPFLLALIDGMSDANAAIITTVASTNTKSKTCSFTG